jgi:cytochrome subunit of sulfide dehydrogenase
LPLAKQRRRPLAAYPTLPGFAGLTLGRIRTHLAPEWLFLLLLAPAIAAGAEPPPGATSCSGCHPTSASADAKVPPLRGRDPAAIVAAMEAFRSGERPSTVMGRIAKGFSDEEIRAIAGWLAAQH